MHDYRKTRGYLERLIDFTHTITTVTMIIEVSFCELRKIRVACRAASPFHWLPYFLTQTVWGLHQPLRPARPDSTPIPLSL